MPGAITFPSDFDFLNNAVRYGPHDRWHLPDTEGFRAWFVDPAALPGGTGTRRTSPLQTIAAALTLATAGDVIYLLPGDHDVNVAGRLSVNTDRLTLIGFGDSTIVRNTNVGATGVLELVGIDVRLIGCHVFGTRAGPRSP